MHACDSYRALYHCNNCQKDISNTVRIKCAVCPDFDLCLECFSVGVQIHPHRNDHAYRVVDNLSFPLFHPDWGVRTPCLLLFPAHLPCSLCIGARVHWAIQWSYRSWQRVQLVASTEKEDGGNQGSPSPCCVACYGPRRLDRVEGESGHVQSASLQMQLLAAHR